MITDNFIKKLKRIEMHLDVVVVFNKKVSTGFIKKMYFYEPGLT